MDVVPLTEAHVELSYLCEDSLGVALLGVGAWIFVGRSGHTAGVPVPAIELKLRAFWKK